MRLAMWARARKRFAVSVGGDPVRRSCAVRLRQSRDEGGSRAACFTLAGTVGTLCTGTRYRHVDHEARIWDLIESTGAGMLTTRFAGGLRARPLEPRPDRERGVIYFITDVRGLKDDEIEADSYVCFTLTNAHDKAYLSISARAAVLTDPLLAAKFWKKTDDAWWPAGPEDRHVRVLRLEPLRAELWDGPASQMVAAYEFAKARATGQKPNLGENRKVTVDLR